MITSGAIFVERGTLLPKPLHLEEGNRDYEWAQVANDVDGHRLEDELATAGWTFFYLAGEIKTTAFGFDLQKMAGAAVERLIRETKRRQCNCLEIDEVSMHSFFGIPYLKLSAHSRHIQKGMIFGRNAGETSERRRSMWLVWT